MATEENYQENQENDDPESAETKPSRRSEKEGMIYRSAQGYMDVGDGCLRLSMLATSTT